MSGHFTGLSRAYVKRDALARLAHAYHSARGVAICADCWERVLWVEIHHSANLSRATTTDWILGNFLGSIPSSRLVVSGAGLVWQDFHTSSLSSTVASMWLMWYPSGVSCRWLKSLPLCFGNEERVVISGHIQIFSSMKTSWVAPSNWRPYHCGYPYNDQV